MLGCIDTKTKACEGEKLPIASWRSRERGISRSHMTNLVALQLPHTVQSLPLSRRWLRCYCNDSETCLGALHDDMMHDTQSYYYKEPWHSLHSLQREKGLALLWALHREMDGTVEEILAEGFGGCDSSKSGTMSIREMHPQLPEIEINCPATCTSDVK